MRDRRLKRVEAIIERQQRMTTEGDDDRLVFQRQHPGMRLLRPPRQISDRGPLLPLRHGLLVDPVAPGQSPQALLTIVYCATDCLCRCGAAMKNLAQSASFHSIENIAPSKPGIRQLGPGPINLV